MTSLGALQGFLPISNTSKMQIHVTLQHWTLMLLGNSRLPFTAVDGTHTKSRYQMMLLIACGIDAIYQVIPLARALVHIEETLW